MQMRCLRLPRKPPEHSQSDAHNRHKIWKWLVLPDIVCTQCDADKRKKMRYILMKFIVMVWKSEGQKGLKNHHSKQIALIPQGFYKNVYKQYI